MRETEVVAKAINTGKPRMDVDVTDNKIARGATRDAPVVSSETWAGASSVHIISYFVTSKAQRTNFFS